MQANRVALGSIAAVYIYFLGPLIFTPYARDVAGAVTRTEFGRAKIVKPSSDSGRGAARDVRESFLSEDAERTGGCEMAPDVESALDAGIVTKPVGHHGVFTSLFFAFIERERRRHLRDELQLPAGGLRHADSRNGHPSSRLWTADLTTTRPISTCARKVCASVYVSNSFPQGLSSADKAAIGLRTPRRD